MKEALEYIKARYKKEKAMADMFKDFTENSIDYLKKIYEKDYKKAIALVESLEKAIEILEKHKDV